MKKAGKIILYFILSIFFLIVILVIVAAFSENKIARLAFDQVSKTTDIPIEVGEIEFSLIHDFPLATLKCRNLVVSLPEHSDKFGQDTAAFISDLFISVDAKPLLKSIFNVRKIEIENGKAFYLADSTGLTNIDLLLDTTGQNVIDTSGNNIFLDIKDFTVKNFKCIVRDENQKATANVLINQLNLSGIIDNEKYMGEAEGNVYLTNCSFDTTNLYLMNRTKIDFKVAYDDGRLTVNQTNIEVDDDIKMSVNGSVNMNENMSANIKVIAEKINLAGFIKYVPETYLSEYGIRDFSGMLSAEANISGLVTDSVMPRVDATFRLSDGKLKVQDYPDLNGISFTGKATNGEQKNNSTTVLDLDRLNFRTASSKFSFSGTIKNPDMPAYNIKSKLEIDLKEFLPYIPDTLFQSLDGKVNAEISTKGTLPDSITDSFIQAALLQTYAKCSLTDVNAVIDSSLMANQISGEVNLQPGEIAFINFSAEIPSYDINVKNVNAVVIGNLVKFDSLNTKINSLNACFHTYDFDVNKLKAEFTGDISNPESLVITIDSLLAESGSNKMELSGTIKNPLAPNYSVSGFVNLNLEEIKKYIPDSLVNALSGKVSASFHSSAVLNLDSISDQFYELIFEKSSFSLALDQISAEMPDTLMNVSHLTGQMKYHSDTLEISHLKAGYSGMQMGMNSVTISNVYSAAVLNQPKELRIHGNFEADKLDYAKLSEFMEEDTAIVSVEEETPMNFTYKINGRFKANTIKYEDALFTNVRSKFLVKSDYFVFDSLRMDAFDGSTLSSIKIEMKGNDEMDLYFKTDIDKMDVYKFMVAFDKYLDYEDFKAENVRGIIKAKMDGRVLLKNFEPEYETMMLKGDLTLTNGALINVKPVMEVEKVTGVGLKNMDKLYFSTLSSSLFLFDNELYVPITEIKSTSFDAGFLGMYSFGEDYDYHIRMFLGEVLTSKSKSNLKKLALDSGFSEEETNDVDVTKGRTAIYLVSKSENGKEKAGFDKKRDRANMIAKVNLQKQMVDMRFHPTLVNYNTEE